MAVGDEQIGYGGTLEINDGVGPTFVVVDKIISLGIPSQKLGIVESKRLDLSGRVIKKLATLIDPGEVSVKIQFTNEGFERFIAIRDACQTGTEYQARFTIPDDEGDTEITVPVIVTEVKTDPLEAEKITEFEVMITVSGDEV